MENCAFCNRSMFEERIIAETDEFFVIATLGQITDGGYTLIFPKRHAICLSALCHEETVKFSKLLLEVGLVTLLEYDIFPAIFEHGIVGQTVKHAHLHVVPTLVNFTSRVMADFTGTDHKSFKQSFTVRDNEIFHQPPQESPPYLFWRSAKEHRPHVLWNPQNVPAQYFRTILAEALGRPERANWRTMDSVLDKRLWSETVSRLKKYF